MNEEEKIFLSDEAFQTNRVESYTNLIIYNCIFNLIGREELIGGSIYIKCNMTNNITKCIFSNCFAKSGGAIYITSEIDTLTYIQSCIFYNNYVLKNGGSLCALKTKILIFDSQFLNNSIIKKNSSDTEKLGGAIFINCIDSNFQNCSFKNNYIFSIISSNAYRSSGGAIYFSNSSYYLMNCSFINNTLFCINSGSWNDGGAISSNFSSNVTFNQCLFKNNTIYCIDDCFVIIGGGMLLISCNTIIVGCSFIENSILVNVANSFQLGGAINLFESNSTIDCCLFIQNDALHGGDIFFCSKYSIIKIRNSTFDRKNNYQNITRSLIGFLVFGDYFNFTFINNKIKIQNSNDVYAFAFDIGCDFINCEFNNNCIFPYNNTLFVDSMINITGPFGENILIFDKIFNTACYDQYYSSYFYPNSNPFSQTLEFSKSECFLQTSQFSKSEYYTYKTIFINSNYYPDKLTKSLYMSSNFRQTLESNNANQHSDILSSNIISNIFAKSKSFLTELSDDGDSIKVDSQKNSIYFEYSYQNTKNNNNKYFIIMIIGLVTFCIFTIMIIILIMYKIKRQKRLIYNANDDPDNSFTSYDEIYGFGI